MPRSTSATNIKANEVRKIGKPAFGKYVTSTCERTWKLVAQNINYIADKASKSRYSFVIYLFLVLILRYRGPS